MTNISHGCFLKNAFHPEFLRHPFLQTALTDFALPESSLLTVIEY